MMARPTATSAAATVMMKKTKDLPVIIRQSGGVDPEAGKGDKREIGRVQHQLERHKNDDDVPAQEHAGKAEGEEQPAHEKIMAERHHRQRSSRLLSTITPMVATRMSTPMIWNGRL